MQHQKLKGFIVINLENVVQSGFKGSLKLSLFVTFYEQDLQEELYLINKSWLTSRQKVAVTWFIFLINGLLHVFRYKIHKGDYIVALLTTLFCLFLNKKTCNISHLLQITNIFYFFSMIQSCKNYFEWNLIRWQRKEI